MWYLILLLFFTLIMFHKNPRKQKTILTFFSLAHLIMILATDVPRDGGKATGSRGQFVRGELSAWSVSGVEASSKARQDQLWWAVWSGVVGLRPG